MKLKAVSGTMLTLLVIGMLTLAFNIQPAKAYPKTIYMKDDNGTYYEWENEPSFRRSNPSSLTDSCRSFHFVIG